MTGARNARSVPIAQAATVNPTAVLVARVTVTGAASVKTVLAVKVNAASVQVAAKATPIGVTTVINVVTVTIRSAVKRDFPKPWGDKEKGEGKGKRDRLR